MRANSQLLRAFRAAAATTAFQFIGAATLLMLLFGVQASAQPAGQIFADVPVGTPVFDATATMSQLGITSGCGTAPLIFCPGSSLQRQDMAAFVVRSWSVRIWDDPEGFVSGTPQQLTPYFSDVPASDPQFKYIQKLYELGITGGCSAPVISSTGQLVQPGFFCPNSALSGSNGTLQNFAVAIFVARTRSLSDNNCKFQYSSVPKPFTTSPKPECGPDAFSWTQSPYFSDVPTTDTYFKWIQRMADLNALASVVSPPPSTNCTNCTFGKSTVVTRSQMALETVNGIGLVPRPILTFDGPTGPNSTSSLPTVKIPFWFRHVDEQNGADDVHWAQFYLADSNGGVHCYGNWGRPNGLTLYNGSAGTTKGFGIYQADSMCSVSLESISNSKLVLSDTTDQVATVVLNFVVNPGFTGTYSVMSQVNYLTSADANFTNVGTVTINAPSTSVAPATIQLTDTTQSSGYYFSNDSYTVSVAGGANLPVSFSRNGINSGEVGSTDASGHFSYTGKWPATSPALNANETWYTGGVEANPKLLYSVLPANDTSGPPSTPNSFNAPLPSLPCTDISGSWVETTSGGNENEWSLMQNDDGSVTGSNYYAYCGSYIELAVTGSWNGATLVLTESPHADTLCYYYYPPVRNTWSPLSRSILLSGASCSDGTSSNYNSGVAIGTSTWAAKTTAKKWVAKPTPHYAISYASYIPVDNIAGPRPCVYPGSLPLLIYAGDAYRYTYRTAQTAILVPGALRKYNFVADTGPTRNYGYGSPSGPFVGAQFQATLSSIPTNPLDLFNSPYFGLDEDEQPNDCFKWNAKGKGDTTAMSSNTFNAISKFLLSNGKSSLELRGSGKNPLEDQDFTPPIVWDMLITIDESNPSAPLARVDGSHTCYPAHRVTINGTHLYDSQVSYKIPLVNNAWYLARCLFQWNPLTQVAIPISGSSGLPVGLK